MHKLVGQVGEVAAVRGRFNALGVLVVVDRMATPRPDGAGCDSRARPGRRLPVVVLDRAPAAGHRRGEDSVPARYRRRTAGRRRVCTLCADRLGPGDVALLYNDGIGERPGRDPDTAKAVGAAGRCFTAT